MILSDDAHAANLTRLAREMNLALEAAHSDGLAIDLNVLSLDVRNVARPTTAPLVQLQIQASRPIACA